MALPSPGALIPRFRIAPFKTLALTSMTWSGQAGSFRLDVLSIGDVALPLAEAFRGPDDPTARDVIGRAVEGQLVIPLQDLLVRGHGFTMLVDAGAYDITPSSTYAIPGYVPPPSLLTQLQRLGVTPSEVQHVVVTHRHWDHFNGTTVESDGRMIPAFPNARHYLGRADWDHVQPMLADETSREARGFGPLAAGGLLDVIDGDRTLESGVRILAAPGETAGHQVVRIESSGEVFFAVGDLIHHPIEITHPDWMVSWADPTRNQASRARFLADAAPARAMVMASHVPEIGRIVSHSSGAYWETVGSIMSAES